MPMIRESDVKNVRKAKELLAEPGQVVIRVHPARSVSMHRTGCKVVLVFVTTAWHHTIQLTNKTTAINALTTSIPSPANRDVGIVKMMSTASEA